MKIIIMVSTTTATRMMINEYDVDNCHTLDRRIRRTTKMMMMIMIATPKTGGSVACESRAIDIINSVEGERSEVNKKKLFIYL